LATTFREVIGFWFEEIDKSLWWAKDPAFDELIAARFGALHAEATRCELFGWRADPEGRLAEIVVLDQFSRNIFRGRPESFAFDPLALVLAQEAVATQADSLLSAAKRNFLYMPFMHSESIAIHQSAQRLYETNGDPQTIEFARRHRRIVEQFGRYPHRNSILSRQSTAEELEFLTQPGSAF
jgi:uncharacterized protein (DUF924 family)